MPISEKNNGITRFKMVKLGAISSIPMIIGGIPFGIIFGSLAVSQGLPIWVPIAMSLIV